MGIIGAILGIIIFLFALAWTQGMFGDATSKLDEGRTFELVNRLRANVKESFFGQSTYGAADTDLVPRLMRMGKVPASARDGGNIVSPYGGGIAIRGRGRRFEIVVADMDDDACAKLVSRFAGAAAGQFGVMRINVAGTAPTAVYIGAPTATDAATVEATCNSGPNANDVTITFR